MAISSRSASARERILDTAARLFYEHGYHSVGIDRIIAESGVAKMTLYHHFASKDDLIVAALQQMDKEFWRWMDLKINSAKSPRDKLIAIFTATQKLASSPECLGCAFQAAASDFPDKQHLNHQAALAHKQEVLSRLTGLAREAKLLRPGQLAQQLLLLMDGAWASARMYGAGGPAKEIIAAARALIDAHTPLARKKDGIQS